MDLSEGVPVDPQFDEHVASDLPQRSVLQSDHSIVQYLNAPAEQQHKQGAIDQVEEFKNKEALRNINRPAPPLKKMSEHYKNSIVFEAKGI